MTTLAGPRPGSRPRPAPLGDFAPVRPSLLTVWPKEDGYFGIDVRWHGRECILRAVVVRRILSEAGFATRSGNSLDGRTWELQVDGVPGDRVAKVIDSLIW